MNEKSQQTPMNERVKKYVPISNVAARFGVSRPTIYLFMKSYDAGKFQDIPENVKEFLDLIAQDPQPEDVKVYLTVKGTTEGDGKPIKIKDVREDTSEYEAMIRELQSLSIMVDKTEGDVRRTRNELKNAEAELNMVSELIDRNPEDNAEYRMRAENLKKKIDSLEEQMKSTLDQNQLSIKKMREMQSRLDEYECTRHYREINRMGSWTEDGDLMTLCVGNSGRSMVFFQFLADDASDDLRFSVSLVMDTPVGEMVIGTYIPENGKRFVMIDDILPSIRVQYEVTCEYRDRIVKSGRYPLQLK